MQEIFLSPITIPQLDKLIQDAVKKVYDHRESESGVIPSKEELLDVNQVAELLHTTPQNIHAKKRTGQIPFVRFGGRILFKRSEVIESLKSIRIHKGQ